MGQGPRQKRRALEDGIVVLKMKAGLSDDRETSRLLPRRKERRKRHLQIYESRPVHPIRGSFNWKERNTMPEHPARGKRKEGAIKRRVAQQEGAATPLA